MIPMILNKLSDTSQRASEIQIRQVGKYMPGKKLKRRHARKSNVGLKRSSVNKGREEFEVHYNCLQFYSAVNNNIYQVSLNKVSDTLFGMQT